MTKPFENLTNTQVNKLYKLLGVHVYKYDKNEEILPTIRKNNIIGIIIQGSAKIECIEYNGNENLIENLHKDSVFGTHISGINSDDYQIISKEKTEVVVIDYSMLLNSKNQNYIYFNIFLSNLFDIINIKLKEKNERIRILEKKQIREKLLEYFDIEYKKNHSKVIQLPFSLKDLADYMAINRSAMFRELKNLKEDKFIEVKNKKIILLNK